MSVKSSRQNAGTFTGASAANGVPPNQGDTGAGTDSYLGRFSATAYGPPWVGIQGTGVTADGTDLRPARKIYGVAVDPKVVPLGTFLHIQPNPFDNYSGTFKAFDTGSAIKGNRIDFYDWRGRAKQRAWGVKTVQVYKASGPNSKLEAGPDGSNGVLSHINLPNPLKALSVVDEAAGAIVDLIKFVLSPKAIGELLAKIVAYVVKSVWKAIWQYVIAPIFHWEQRAAVWYYQNIMLEKGDDTAASVLDMPGVKATVTLLFWVTGYGILWVKADTPHDLITEPHKTPLGSFLRSVGNTRARGSLVKPKDVKRKTPQKPEPQSSSVKITEQRRVAATRPRQIRVSGADEAAASNLAADAETIA